MVVIITRVNVIAQKGKRMTLAPYLHFKGQMKERAHEEHKEEIVKQEYEGKRRVMYGK